MKVLCFSSRKYEIETYQKLKTEHELVFLEESLNEKTVDLCKGYEAVSIFVNDQANKAVLEKLNALGVKALFLRSAGYNHVDQDSLGSIKAYRVPSYSPHAIAEHTLALALTLNRKTHKAYHRVRDGNFSLQGLVGFDFYQKTVGVIGYGKIGSIVCDLFLGFGCEVLVFDPYFKEKNKNIQFVDLPTLLKKSKIITLHCPLTKENVHLLSEKEFDHMEEGVMLLNTSRGKLVDTKALIKNLKSKKIGSVGLDVYEEEEGVFFEDHSEEALLDDDLARLQTFPQVLITGHQAFLTEEALLGIAKTTLENIDSYQQGQKSENLI